MEEEPARPAAPAAPVDEAAPDEGDAPDEGAGGSRRRGRTPLLIAAAAVLGLVAGTCTGVLVQADREPTKLPPLSQAALARGEGPAPKPLPAAQDRRVRTDGDLRELLLEKPRGAREAEWLESVDGWMDLPTYAATFGRPDEQFSQYVHDDFRRAAVTGWETGATRTVEIRLIQFRQEEVLSALEGSDNGRHWAGWAREGDTDRWPLPGTGDGEVFVHNRPESEDGSPPFYSAEAHAWRGDIEMEIWMTGTERIGKDQIMDLARRQMERL
ncbi:hypothetical protein BSZ07_20360 [Streptomyces sp. M1013]|uniref:hypothetical protein n=1 Tax=Streptomyces sp. M1013 TaxID=549798 RepID=UPI000979021A|nr:hypothetical protein [Streptomyces sp. M1013]OMI87810.1 hypothetical protein BSZ07_20360 [Streptomyces sp. M1013]